MVPELIGWGLSGLSDSALALAQNYFNGAGLEAVKVALGQFLVLSLFPSVLVCLRVLQLNTKVFCFRETYFFAFTRGEGESDFA